MKRKLATIIITCALGACSTVDIERAANDAVSAGFNSVMSSIGGSTEMSNNSGTSTQTPNTRTHSESVKNERVETHSASRTSRGYGSIKVVQTAKNPKGQTKLVLDGCNHPRIGELRCGGYIFEVSNDGWLIDNPIAFDDLNNPTLVLAAGTYYLKFHNWDSGFNRFATGNLEIKPFVTNHVFVELE